MKAIKFSKYYNAVLAFSDGTFFLGKGIGKKNNITAGEICFTTSITGYQELLTDPSYAGQIITFTAPHIGNVGCNKNDMESSKAWCRGVILREPISEPSNYRSEESLNEWLIKQDVTGICEIDTRAITTLVRNKGPQGVVIYYGNPDEEVDIDKLVPKAIEIGTLDLSLIHI